MVLPLIIPAEELISRCSSRERENEYSLVYFILLSLDIRTGVD